MTELIAAVVGGFLAAGTGWFLQSRAEKSRLDRTRNLLSIAICDDLQHTVTVLERLDDEWDKTKTVWFATLNELKESRQSFKNNKDWIVVFEDAELRRRVFRYYLRSSDLINNAEYQQRRKYELEGKFNDMVRDIKFKTPALSEEQSRQMAISYMQNENNEYMNLENQLPETVKKLAALKPDAKELATQVRASAL